MSLTAFAEIGLQALPFLGSIFGGGVTHEERAKYEQAVREREAKIMQMKLDLSLRKQGYAAARDTNLGAAADGYMNNINSFWSSYETFQRKQAVSYAKSRSQKGKLTASGDTGKSRERIEKFLSSQKLMEGRYLALAMERKSWELNRANKKVWESYNRANQQAYDNSRLGIPISLPPIIAPPKKRNKGLFGLLGLVGNTIIPGLTNNPLANSFGNLLSGFSDQALRMESEQFEGYKYSPVVSSTIDINKIPVNQGSGHENPQQAAIQTSAGDIPLSREQSVAEPVSGLPKIEPGQDWFAADTFNLAQR